MMRYVNAFRMLVEQGYISSPAQIQTFLHFTNYVLRSKNTTQAFLYFCKYGEGTAEDLRITFNMNDATVYRTLKRLRELHIIVEDRKLKYQRRGGQRTTLWRLDE